MADKKISQLTGASTPLAGTEVLPIVQSGSTVKVAVSDLTAGRAVSAASLALTGTALPVSSGGTGLSAVTAGYVPFGSSSTVLSTDAGLFWDNSNKRLGVGTTSPSQKVQIGNNPGNNGASNYLSVEGSGGTGLISSGVKLINYWNSIPYEAGIYASQTDNAAAELAFKVGYFNGSTAAQRTGILVNQDANVSLPLGNLVFGTADKGINTSGANAFTFNINNAEKGRFNPSGFFKASNDGTYLASTFTYHELRSNQDTYTARMTNKHATDPYGLNIYFTDASPNGIGNQFLLCEDSTATRAIIRSNGGLANYQANNSDLSDARTKKDITPAESMWGKIGALEIVTYKYNDQTHDDVNLGVIAQQVETVEPVWVENDGFGDTPKDGVPLKTVYTKDIYFAAIKALQEAMGRIEKLEAEVAKLKGA